MIVGTAHVVGEDRAGTALANTHLEPELRAIFKNTLPNHDRENNGSLVMVQLGETRYITGTDKALVEKDVRITNCAPPDPLPLTWVLETRAPRRLRVPRAIACAPMAAIRRTWRTLAPRCTT